MGGGSIYEKEGGVMRKRGVGDKICHSLSSKGQRVPITNESSSSIWWAVLGERVTSAWGGIPGFPPPCMKPCMGSHMCHGTLGQDGQVDKL